MAKVGKLVLAWGIAAALGSSACSSNQHAQNAATPAPIAAPKLDVALYPGAKVVSVHDFTQNVNIKDGETQGAVLGSGNGTYVGREAIAASPASFAQLDGWVRSLKEHPPTGYSPAGETDESQRFGMDYAGFKKTESGKPKGLLVLVMDPTRVTARLGPVLKLISTYKVLPEPMRASIDNQVKAQTGMSVSEALQPDSPIGASLAALDDFQHTNERAIIVLEATKQ
jgi:hypothetical protein